VQKGLARAIVHTSDGLVGGEDNDYTGMCKVTLTSASESIFLCYIYIMQHTFNKILCPAVLPVMWVLEILAGILLYHIPMLKLKFQYFFET